MKNNDKKKILSIATSAAVIVSQTPVSSLASIEDILGLTIPISSNYDTNNIDFDIEEIETSIEDEILDIDNSILEDNQVLEAENVNDIKDTYKPSYIDDDNDDMNLEETKDATPLSDFSYTETDDSITLTNYIGGNESVVILGEYNGKRTQITQSFLRKFKNNGVINLTIKEESGIKALVTSNSLDRAFYDSQLKVINLDGLDTKNVTTMEAMFAYCEQLTTVNLGRLDTSNVTSMYNMFYNCTNLMSLDLTGFNTSKVENMSFMFSNCSTLKNLNLKGFDTSNVTNMSYMFYQCSSLVKLDLTDFKTNNVTTMSSMFSNCNSLTSLDLKSFDTNNTTSMFSMFSDCSNLISLDLTNFNTTNVSDLYITFFNCNQLKIIATSDTQIINEVSSIPGLKITFNSNYGKFSDNTTSKTTSAIKTVPDFNKETIDEIIENALNDIEKPTREGYIFDSWTTANTSDKPEDRLNATYTANWRTNTPASIETPDNQTYFKVEYGKDINLNDYFIISDTETSYDDLKIEITENIDEKVGVYEVNCTVTDSDNNTVTKTINFEVYLPDWNYTIDNDKNIVLSEYTGTENVLNIEGVMGGRDTIITLNVFNKLKDSTVTNLSIKETDGKKVLVSGQSLKQAFYENENIKNIDLSGLDTSNITNMAYMFTGCNNLETLNLSGFNTDDVTNMGYMFSGCRKLTSLDVTSFNTSNVTDMALMFRNCSSLTTLDLSNFDTSKVSRMAYIFANCSSLTSLDLSNFDTSSVNYVDDMFENCTNLKIIATSDVNLIEEAEVISGSTMTFNASDGKFLDDTTEKTTTVIKTVPNFKKETIDKVVKDILDNTEEPTREGYVFNGWSTDNTSDKVEDRLNATYTANWKAQKPSTPPTENGEDNTKPPTNNGDDSSGNKNDSSSSVSGSNANNSSSNSNPSSSSSSSSSSLSSNTSSSSSSTSDSLSNSSNNSDSSSESSVNESEETVDNTHEDTVQEEEYPILTGNTETKLKENKTNLFGIIISLIAGLSIASLFIKKKDDKDNQEDNKEDKQLNNI